MPDAFKKALATITDPGTNTIEDAPNGGFVAVLSTPSKDRDGDVLDRDGWKSLPSKITLDVDHLMTAEGTIGSAVPYFDDATGNLMIDAKFASNSRAQAVRDLVREGHLDSVSVAFMPDMDSTTKDGKPKRELLNAAVVGIPSNRDARITSWKAFDAIEAQRKAVTIGDDVEIPDAFLAKAKKDDGPTKPYGDVDYADPGYLDGEGKPAKTPNDGQCRYPLNTASRVRTGWGYIHHEDIASQYTAEQLGHIEDKLKAAAEKFGIKIDDGDDKKDDDKKSADMARIVTELSHLRPVESKAGARNSAQDGKMIQAIHDAASILGADCVSEAAPDENDGASEGANKGFVSGELVRNALVVGKSLNGSLEDMQSRLQDALCEAAGCGDYGSAWPWIIATYMNPDGNGGSVVYRQGGETLCRAFSDDGSCVALDSNIQVVTVITSVAPVPDTVDGDPVMLPPAAAEAAKSAPADRIHINAEEAMDMEQFKAALDTITETKTSGPVEPGSPATPATDVDAVSPDSKAAPKSPADQDESADAADEEAAEADTPNDDESQEKRARNLRMRVLALNARTEAFAS